MPDFVVIAGPNGSGKSFYSTEDDSSLAKTYATRSFDFDFRFSELFKSFLNIMTLQIEENLHDRVKEIFEEEAEEALETFKSFSFQTNFDNHAIDLWRQKFSNRGFNTVLTFLFLEDVELCKKRVELRVSNGGHYVDSKTIETRYIKGLINLDTYFSKYTQVTIIDSSSFAEIKQLFDYSNGKVKYIDEKFIDIVSNYNLINLKSSIDSFMNSHEA